MKYSSNNYVTIKCPYFLGETESGINCEGCMEKTKKTYSLFESESAKKNYIAIHCTEYPNNCPVSKVNDTKYERE